MPLNEPEARQLLKAVLNDLWSADPRPILGSRLKAALVANAVKNGTEFDERLIGYQGFADFVSRSAFAAVKFRAGMDILIAPIEYAAELDRGPQKRVTIRPDFWRAFVGFMIVDEARAYDQARDTVVVGPRETIPADAVPIDPIPPATQLEWRRNFLNNLGPDSPLATIQSALRSQKGFKAFAEGLRRYPNLRASWNQAWMNEVSAVIRAWGQQYGIPDEVWLKSPGVSDQETLRAKLYDVLDAIPIENLLEISIPLRWLVEKRPSK